MNYQFFAQSDPGRTRKNNEDAVAFDAATKLVVLADGMGGYNAGEVASAMATSWIISELSSWLNQAGAHAKLGQVRRAMELSVSNANRAIYNAANTNPQYSKMGTTLVIGVFREDWLLLGHIGDSRCYRLRGHVLRQITKDHSLLQEQIDAGLLTPQQAAASTNKNLVTRALGVAHDVVLELKELRVEAGDIFLMCSDGLSDMVPDTEMAGVLDNGMALGHMATALVSRANEKGGRDNISVLLTQAAGTLKKRGLISRLLGRKPIHGD